MVEKLRVNLVAELIDTCSLVEITFIISLNVSG